MRKKIIAICGSTRKKSVNELILNIVSELYREVLEIQIFKGLTDLPHFNPDLGDDRVGSHVENFRKLIDQADGVLICSPEYVFSVPGSLKNALEWTVSTMVFSNKPAALIVASGAGEKAFESLILILKTLGVRMEDRSTLLIQGARSKYNATTQELDSETLRKIHELMTSFMATMNTEPVPND